MARQGILRATEGALLLSLVGMLVLFIDPEWLKVDFYLPNSSYRTSWMYHKYGLWFMQACLTSYFEGGVTECRTMTYHQIRENIWMFDKDLLQYNDEFHICFTSSYMTIIQWETSVTCALAIGILALALTNRQRSRNADLLAGKSSVGPSICCLKFIIGCCCVQDVVLVAELVRFLIRNRSATAVYGPRTTVKLPVCLVAGVIATALSLLAVLFLAIVIFETPTPRRRRRRKQEIPLVDSPRAQQAPAEDAGEPV